MITKRTNIALTLLFVLTPALHGAQNSTTNGLCVQGTHGLVNKISAQVGSRNGKVHLNRQCASDFRGAASNAYQYVQKHGEEYGASKKDLKKGVNVSISVPTRHEGSSAGITMACAMMSAFTDYSIDPSYAMTGTIDRNGRVGQIGSLKYKMQAAYRDGIRKIIIPQGNYGDFQRAGSIRHKIEPTFVRNVDEVFDVVLI